MEKNQQWCTAIRAQKEISSIDDKSIYLDSDGELHNVEIAWYL